MHLQTKHFKLGPRQSNEGWSSSHSSSNPVQFQVVDILTSPSFVPFRHKSIIIFKSDMSFMEDIKDKKKTIASFINYG